MTSVASSHPKSISVLPAKHFTTEIVSARDRYLGLTLADALIDSLGRYREIVVGRSLRVDATIESHFLRTGDQVRFTVRFIDARSGVCQWTGDFASPASDITAFAGEAALGIAEFLGLTSTRIPRQVARRASRRDPEAYELYGRGRSHLLAGSMFEVVEAANAFRAAIELDPEYSAAHAGLALAFCAQAEFRVTPPAEAYGHAKTAALRALAMDELSADAQVALGAVLFLSEWDWAAAQRTLERAIDLHPNHTEAYLLYGRLLDAIGRPEQGLEMKLRALERDPFSPLVQLQISLSYWNQRQYAPAIEWAQKALDVDPRHPHAREYLSAAYLKMGDFDRHMAESMKHCELHGVPDETSAPLRNAYAEGGRAGVVRFVLNRFSQADRESGASAVMLAIFHAETGEMDEAFRHLETALERRDPALVTLRVGPQWDDLRGDPRFDACLRRMMLSPASAAAAGDYLL